MFQVIRSGRRTKKPFFGTGSTRPSSTSIRYAPRTVRFATPLLAISSVVDGSRSPGLYRPETIASRSSPASRSYTSSCSGIRPPGPPVFLGATPCSSAVLTTPVCHPALRCCRVLPARHSPGGRHGAPRQT